MLKELFFILDNNVYALFFLIITAIFALKNTNENSPLTKYIKKIVLFIAVELVLESLIYIVQTSKISFKQEINFALLSLVYITRITIPYFMCMYSMYYTNYIRYIKLKRNIVITPIIIGIFLVILNIFTNILFSVSNEGIIKENIWSNYYYIVQPLHAVITISIISLNIKKLNRKEINSLEIFLLLIVIGIILNSFFKVQFLIVPFMALGVCIELFFLKSNFSQFDNITKLWSREKGEEFIQEVIEEEKYNLTVLYIDYVNIVDKLKNKGEKEVYKDVKKIATILEKNCDISAKKVRYDINKYVVIYLNTRKEKIQKEMDKVIEEINNTSDIKVKYIIQEFDKNEQKTKGQFIRLLEVNMNKCSIGGDVS